MLTFIIPTRDRPERLAQTLAALGSLDGAALAHAGGAEAIVIDNASRVLPILPEVLPSGIQMRLIPLSENHAAASRNLGARAARGQWLIMLDDDSAPLDAGFLTSIAHAEPDVAAIGAEIFLTTGKREAGGLPEVFTGCGVAIRTRVFNALGGYDPSFHYYAEEYDLAARMILAGHRIVHDRRFRVLHHKDGAGRNMNTILARLVRNNAWVMQRYAPEPLRDRFIRETIERYDAIARKENALDGFAQGVAGLHATLSAQARCAMTTDQWDRFTGLAHARAHLRAALGGAPESSALRSIAIIARGKNDWAVEQALRELGWTITDDPAGESCRAAVIGTLSPGPMLDAAEAYHARAQPARAGATACLPARASTCNGADNALRGVPVVAPWSLRSAAMVHPVT